jgi:hypothetical protein
VEIAVIGGGVAGTALAAAVADVSVAIGGRVKVEFCLVNRCTP